MAKLPSETINKLIRIGKTENLDWVNSKITEVKRYKDKTFESDINKEDLGEYWDAYWLAYMDALQAVKKRMEDD